MFFSTNLVKFKKFDLRQLQKSIYSGAEGVYEWNNVGVINNQP
jgi:hypothetical protein